MDRAEAIKVLQSKLHLDCSVDMAIKELEAREVAIDALREQEQSQWISVKERLPELEKEVLICDISDERKYMDIWSLEDDEDGGIVWEGKDGAWYSLDEVTHWTPLPEPPEGGADHA